MLFIRSFIISLDYYQCKATILLISKHMLIVFRHILGADLKALKLVDDGKCFSVGEARICGASAGGGPPPPFVQPERNLSLSHSTSRKIASPLKKEREKKNMCA